VTHLEVGKGVGADNPATPAVLQRRIVRGCMELTIKTSFPPTPVYVDAVNICANIDDVNINL
jgi:hypothetical protein